MPDSPGVYFFRKGKEVTYIGRATSLRDRVKSYFVSDLINTRGKLIVEMVGKADSIKFQKTDSVLEAIILEANLIKKFQPFYNTDAKDDKSFNYVVITDEDFPQVLVVRGHDIVKRSAFYVLRSTIFGPFPNGSALQEALKFIRKIFPYRDAKCKFTPPLTPPLKRGEGKRVGKPCFNRHIGLCPGTCTGEISKKDYAKTIRYIIQIFQGKKKSVLRGLEQEMKRFAKDEDFEKAADIRNKIFALTHIRDVAFIKKENENSMLHASRFTLHNSQRIEAYDMAHLGGKNARGVMVVLEDGEFNKKEYRTFVVRNSKEGDDVGALCEILERRFKHSEWQYPSVAVIDGGQGQLNVALKIIKKYSPKTKVVSVVKNEQHKARAILNTNTLTELLKNEILKLNGEAHRFAIGRYRKAAGKNWLI